VKRNRDSRKFQRKPISRHRGLHASFAVIAGFGTGIAIAVKLKASPRSTLALITRLSLVVDLPSGAT
jgi:hypothetical protein